MKKYQQLLNIITEVSDDAKKFYDKGNSSTGTRLRKAMQNIKVIAQDVRKEVSEIKNS